MRIGELTLIVFIISQFLWECSGKSFGARFFFGASENENVDDFPLRRDGNILVGKIQHIHGCFTT